MVDFFFFFSYSFVEFSLWWWWWVVQSLWTFVRHRACSLVCEYALLIFIHYLLYLAWPQPILAAPSLANISYNLWLVQMFHSSTILMCYTTILTMLIFAFTFFLFSSCSYSSLVSFYNLHSFLLFHFHPSAVFSSCFLFVVSLVFAYETHKFIFHQQNQTTNACSHTHTHINNSRIPCNIHNLVIILLCILTSYCPPPPQSASSIELFYSPIQFIYTSLWSWTH